MALPAGVGRIETLLMQKQVDAERVKLGQERHKVFQAAPQAIDVPGHHYVELALGGVPAQHIERRPTIAALSAADAMIVVDLRHLPAGPFCRPAQLVLLVGRGLVSRRYPQIDRSAFHGFAPLRTDEQAITVFAYTSCVEAAICLGRAGDACVDPAASIGWNAAKIRHDTRALS